MTTEEQRLQAAREGTAPWRRWGPYLSERQWGTVREDYSANGDAWEYLPHDHARSRAYRWGEDGIAGICDDRQQLCFALALWNGADPILKERLFGLTGTEGNHGEDVKEYYFYLDNVPSHAYMKYLYKYPQRAFPYADLVDENRRRGARRSGIRAARHRHLRRRPLLRRVRRVREGRARRHPDPDHRHQPRPGSPRRCTCCRRSGSRTTGRGIPSNDKPRHRASTQSATSGLVLKTTHRELAPYWLYCERAGRSRCSPRTRPTSSGSSACPNASPYVKDALSRIRRGRPARRGEPGADGHEGRAALPAHHRRRAKRW